MKKTLFLLSLIFFINLTFSQDISGPKPIFSSGGNHINPGYTFVLGCNIESETVTASYVDDLGDTSSYRVEVLPYQTKGYLPTAGTTVIAPTAAGASDGEIVPINQDDKWSSIRHLDNNTPFNFCFFGESKNDFIYSANGILSFDTSYAGDFSPYDFRDMGRIAPGADCFVPFYDDNKDSILQFEDTDPTDAAATWDSYVFWMKNGVLNEQYVVMGIHHMPMWSCGGLYDFATYQMVFYETTNIIEFNIKSKPLCHYAWNGQQAFGIQNADKTVGIEVPSLDNAGTLNTYVQIIDPDDAYSASHINPNATFVENKKTVRFIPDGGPDSNHPTFGWYKDWDSSANLGTLVTNNTELTVDKGSIPIDANGDPIPVTYTAVVHYTNTCYNDVYSINTVTFTLDNPIQMHLQEQNSPDDTIEFYLEENIELCPEEDYTLTAIVQDADPTQSFKLEWTVESFGNPATPIQVNDPVTSDANGDVTVDLFIDHTLTDTLTPGVNYTYTCTLTDGTCNFSDTVNILVLDNAYFAYNKTDFCASDTDPEPQNTNPALATPPDPYDPDYYFTVDNGGVWLHPETDATVSLDGVPDLSACFANAVTLNADGSASFTITYHGGCVDNTKEVTITITDAPIVLNPEVGDPTATPPIEPSPLITQCETASNLAEFDLPAINDYIANGSTGLQFDWIDVASNTTITDDNNNSYTSATRQVQVTVTNLSAPSSCPVELKFWLKVIGPPNIIKLQDTATTPLILCEDDTNANPSIHAATFDTTNWDDFILNRPTEQNDAAYDVEYTYVDIDGNTVTTTTLPTNLELTSQSIDSKVIYQIDATTTCDSSVKTFNVTVIDTPIVAAVPTTGITLCETDPISHTAEFDTTSWQNTILGSQPAANYYITYTAVEVAADGTETSYPLPNPLTPNITVPDLKITVTVSYDITAGVNSTCTSTSMDFNLEVIEKPVATPLVNTVNDPPQSTDIALILCETDTVFNTAEFDTTNWNTTILGSDQTTGYNVEYRAVTVDSVTLVETPYALPVPFPEAANISTLPSLKIYIKVFYDIDTTTRCESDEKFFFIETNPSPTISVPTDAGFPIANATLELCEDDTDADPNVHMATFNTTTWNDIILNGQTGANYHVVLTAVDLNGDTVTLPDPLPTNFETESIIITAQVTDDNLPCDSVEMDFKLDVKVIPINNDIPDITQCEDDPLAHTADFDTSNWTATVIGSQDPTNLVVEYTYLDGGVATTVVDTGVAATTTLPATITSVTQTVSVVIKNVTNTISCANPTPETFELKVIETPNITQLADSVTPFVALTICEDDTDADPNVHTAAFDTTNWDNYILNRPTEQNDAAYDVEYTYVDLGGNTQTVNSSSLPNPFILSSQTIKANVRYKIDDTTYCVSDEMSFDVNVRLIPFINQLVDDMDTTTQLVDLQICEDDTNSNTAAFDTSHWNEVILKDNYDNTVTPPTINPDYIIEYTYVDINGASQTVTSTALPNPFVLTSQTIKYTVKNITLNEDTCPSEEKQFDVIVDLLPVGTDGTAVVCSGSTEYITIDNPAATPPTYKPFTFDDFATFTDTGDGNRNTYIWKAIIDNPDVTGESFSDVNNNDNTNPSITDTLINTTQVVQYVTYEVIPFSEYDCEGLPFYITVQVDVAPNMTDQSTTICNEEQVNFDFDVYTSLTGNSYEWYAIDNPNVTGESVLTYGSNGNPLPMTSTVIDDTIINISGVEQIVEYVVIPKSLGGCEGTHFSVFVTVNPRPDFILKPQYFICPEIGSVLIGEDSNPNTYTYYWFEANDINTEIDQNHPMQLEVTESMLASSNGNYVLTVEDNFTHCIYSQFTTVSMAEQMAIASIHVSDFNAPDNTITIAMVGGTGAYEYTLHYVDSNGMSQSITQNSPIFENLDANTYQIEVTDLNNCSVTIFSNDVYVLDYPPFFTPNGDGENDTWSIIGANIIPNSKIYIFDRFGKVLAKVNPNSVLGWDGTYNGVPVPEDDYWFTTEYVDPNTGKPKTVKGHFSIVREK